MGILIYIYYIYIIYIFRIYIYSKKCTVSYLMGTASSCYALRDRVKKVKTCRIYLDNTEDILTYSLQLNKIISLSTKR